MRCNVKSTCDLILYFKSESAVPTFRVLDMSAIYCRGLVEVRSNLYSQ